MSFGQPDAFVAFIGQKSFPAMLPEEFAGYFSIGRIVVDDQDGLHSAVAIGRGIVRPSTGIKSKKRTRGRKSLNEHRRILPLREQFSCKTARQPEPSSR